MRKIILYILFCFPFFPAEAKEKDAKNPVILKTYGEYGYNSTYRHFGNYAVSALFPVNSYLDLQAGVNLGTANIHGIDGRAIVKFPVKRGVVTMENRITYQASVRNRTHNLCSGLSIGYRQDFLRLSAGGYSRLYSPMGNNGNSHNIDFLTEPFNLLWMIEGRLRRDSDSWNLGLRLSNYDDFHIERANEPIITVIAGYMLKESVCLFAEAYCKPSGMFHMAADFFNAGIRVGAYLTINKNKK